MDEFSQVAALTVTEPAANTLTFVQLQGTSPGLFSHTAWIINQVEYYPAADDIGLLLQNAGDWVEFGISTTNKLTVLGISDANIVDIAQLITGQGAPAADQAHIHRLPIVRDFSNLPGGGLIIPAYPLYGFVAGIGLANPFTVYIRLRFITKELKPDEYIELVEASRIIT
jgi:hypothetical protein